MTMDNSADWHPEYSARATGAGRQRSAWIVVAVFGALLGLSLAILAVSLGAYLAAAGRAPNAGDTQASGLVLAISIVTSVVSLVGLLSSNVLAWRREAREDRAAQIQLQRQQLEIEKLKLELERQRREA